jgi:hypothetical protein
MNHPYNFPTIRINRKQFLLYEGIITQVTAIEITASAVLLRPAHNITRHAHRESFAHADGFACWEEMRQWFENQHGLPFTGILIQWNPIPKQP